MNNCYILWYIFNLSVEHFWRFVLDQQDGFGSTNFSTAFRLRNCHFFAFFCFFFVIFYRIFKTYFRFSPQSHLPSLPLLQTRANDQLFFSGQFVRPFARSWLTQNVRAVLWSERLCTDLRFSVMETVAVILSCRCQVKDWQFSVWKENIVFPPPKKEIEKNKKWK